MWLSQQFLLLIVAIYNLQINPTGRFRFVVSIDILIHPTSQGRNTGLSRPLFPPQKPAIRVWLYIKKFVSVEK
jgi:hypothetical protein